jgi:hypothetical protein
MEAVRERAAGGYLAIAGTIDVDAWSRGRPAPGEATTWPADPAPFAHPTKILLLDVTRKDQRAANVR